jgi:hypothetical protein
LMLHRKDGGFAFDNRVLVIEWRWESFWEREGAPMLPRQILIALTAAAAIAVMTGADAGAQYVPYYRPGTGGYAGPGPAVSPYLNLLRGRNAAVNYYLGVQSEVERRWALQHQLLGDERRALIGEERGEELFTKLAGTGHPAAFMNYGSYYTFGGQQVGQLNPIPPGMKKR